MQVKKFVLGSVKTTINIVAIENEEVVVVERKCKITWEEFRNVHDVVVQQLAMAKKQLEVTLQSIFLASMQANLKDLKGSSCENTNNIQVHTELNITQYGSNMVLSIVFKPN